ncbi:hypothetical protein EVAR_99273_1 [Eumeta japonica]|uniref:Uncharacterized protein n=1 Tax=Eumeta variegata TaxID=151549 RepID=A0A4C1ZB60_EUMVA|nr:hypothetical protein EVAR_99273_1 [Eumeta japonica]
MRPSIDRQSCAAFVVANLITFHPCNYTFHWRNGMPIARHVADWVIFVGTNIKELPDTTTLKSLNLDFEKAVEIIRVFERRYKYSFNRRNLLDFTVGRLKEAEIKLDVSTKKKKANLEVYFRNVDSDELTSSAELLVMQTLVYEPQIRSDEFEANETYLILVPGMEGHHGVFNTLCERLKIFALCMQPGLDHPRETPRAAAQRLVEGTVFCADSAPDVFPVQLKAFLGDVSGNELQNAVTGHMYTLMTETAYDRIVEAERYIPEHHQMRSKIVLLKSRYQPEALAAYPRDLGLSKYTIQLGDVYDLEAEHADALKDLRCTPIVHKHLQPPLLEEYFEKNLCETYLPNGMKFLELSEQCSFEPRPVVSGSARVRVCGVPRSEVARRQLSHGRPSRRAPVTLPSARRARTRFLRLGATACGPAAALWGRASLSVTASGQTLLVMVNPFRIKFSRAIASALIQRHRGRLRVTITPRPGCAQQQGHALPSEVDSVLGLGSSNFTKNNNMGSRGQSPCPSACSGGKRSSSAISTEEGSNNSDSAIKGSDNEERNFQLVKKKNKRVARRL